MWKEIYDLFTACDFVDIFDDTYITPSYDFMM
jgi:hypothetical protein